jgi:LPXTG-motif cell wall-anchored protein
MRVKRYIAGATTAFALTLAGVGASPASATECTAANFTSGGVFDMEGYLACLSGLPSAGSNSLDTLGVAAGLVVVGGAMMFAGRRRRSLSTPA